MKLPVNYVRCLRKNVAVLKKAVADKDFIVLSSRGDGSESWRKRQSEGDTPAQAAELV